MWILHLVQVSQFHFPQSCLEYIFSNVRDSQALCRKQTASTLLCPLDRLKPGTAGIKIRWKRELMNLLVWWLLIKESLVVQWWHVCHSAKNCSERFLMRFLLWGFGFVFWLMDSLFIQNGNPTWGQQFFMVWIMCIVVYLNLQTIVTCITFRFIWGCWIKYLVLSLGNCRISFCFLRAQMYLFNSLIRCLMYRRGSVLHNLFIN